MGKITYSYNSYPNCPEATEYSKSRASTAAQLGGIVGFASLGAVFGLVYTASEFFSKNNWSDFIGGIVFAIFMLQHTMPVWFGTMNVHSIQA